MSNNNIRISILKGYGILLVVIGHAICNGGAYSFHNFIYLFHLALFYYASGYLYKDKYASDAKSFLLKRIKSLYIPYVMYGSVFLLLHDVFCKVGFYTIESIYAPGDLRLHFFSLLKFDYFEELSGVFWFFKSLFVVSICFEIVIYGVHKFSYNKFLSITIIGILSLIGVLACYYSFPGSKTIANLALLPIFYMGYYVSRNSVKICTYVLEHYSIIVALGCLVVLILNTNDLISINAQNIGTNPLIFYLCSFCGIYLTLYLTDHTPRIIRYMIDCLGRNSAPIFIWHFLFFRLASYLLIKIDGLEMTKLACHPVIPNHIFTWTLMYIVIGIGGSLFLGYIIQFAKRKTIDIASEIKNML